MARLITKDQTRVLRTLAARTLGACECARSGREPGQCDYHDWLFDGFGVASTLSLSFAQADRAIAHLKGLAPPREGTPAPRRTAPPSRYAVAGATGMVTQAQADRLASLEDQLGWQPETPGAPSSRLQGMARRQQRLLPNVAVLVAGLTRKNATSLITGLDRLLSHNRSHSL